ncbi:MAG: pyridoxal phosphate-dependent aminotransferase [Clostridia bacterium]|nr:pyridoxal phosphate-dependent aminotransferase [Clostridia bacterium]
MLNESSVALGKVRSSIRELFEYGKKRKAEIGEENVFDFSIGNPSIEPPKEVRETLTELLNTCNQVDLHGYTSAQGDYGVRKTLADYTNERFGTSLNADCFYMTCGAAASLTITFNAILNPGDEVILFAPYFPEYKVFIEKAGGKVIVLQGLPGSYHIDFAALEQAITPKTKAILINSPNNPSGVVYTEDEIKRLACLLKCRSTDNPIYFVSDEPYRELVYDSSIKVPYIMNYYDRSIVCYSYSKSLSLPGERIGYVAVDNKMEEFADVYAGVCGAGRALGFVCAPSLFQMLVGKVYDKTSDMSIYKANRDMLYDALISYGYEVIHPDGAFYMFVKAMEEDSKAFAERAKQYELLIVPGDDFGSKGYVRVSYCVSPDTIRRALPAFKALADSYKK